jgi:hypothetical protein
MDNDGQQRSTHRRARGLALWTFDEFLNHDFGEGVFLCDPIIPAGGDFLLHGPRAAGKTQFALTLGVAVARGEYFLNQYRCDQGRVVYFQADVPEKLFQQRIRNLEHLCKGLPIDFLTVGRRFDVNKAAKNPPGVIKRAGDLNPALVIVDSLRKTHDGDENDSNTPSRVYDAWHALFPTATHGYLHHDRKASRDAYRDLSDEDFRGSGAWIDDVDTGLHLIRSRKKGGHIATLTYSKLRTCEEKPPMLLGMGKDTLLMEPAKPTVLQHARQYLQEHPTATRGQVAQYLQSLRDERGKPVCSRSWAYENAKLALQEGGAR